MPAAAPSIVWFRQDLRLDDNPALRAAVARGKPLICLYILDDDAPGDWKPGGASRWWLYKSLKALDADLRSLGQRLIFQKGPVMTCYNRLIKVTGPEAVFWNRLYDPWSCARDKSIKSSLKNRGLTAESFNAALLREPWEVKTKTGSPFKVFSAYWRASLALGPMTAPEARPRSLPQPVDNLESDDLEDWKLLPTKPDWAGGLRAAWTSGEKGARAQLKTFLEEGIQNYAHGRDRPDRENTSRLSPHLHFGEISPRRIWAMLARTQEETELSDTQADKFRAELGWREFSHHLLYDNPDLPETALRPEFRNFPWRDDPAALKAWQKGFTGFPIVDAGMRELWTTGWMHNRVRMITASLLVKHLLIPWQRGAAWFWDTLVDADLANNSASWQWVAGCGADAAPYFRIFNPVLQGEKFDPDGKYVRRWVPEIKALPGKFIHRPWEAPASILAGAGISLGDTYPEPIVDLKIGRERALSAYKQLSK